MRLKQQPVLSSSCVNIPYYYVISVFKKSDTEYLLQQVHSNSYVHIL
jgi:hypothetical protein